MKELKTLEDFELEIEGQGLVIDWIKQEAIKWVKEFDLNPRETKKEVTWIMHFFNLTEEDLK